MDTTHHVPYMHKWLRNYNTEAGHRNIGIWQCQAKWCDSRGKNSEGIYIDPAGENCAGKISKLRAWGQNGSVRACTSNMPSNWFFIIPVLFSSSIAVFSANRQCLDLATVHLQPTRLGLTEIVYKSDVLTWIVNCKTWNFPLGSLAFHVQL